MASHKVVRNSGATTILIELAALALDGIAGAWSSPLVGLIAAGTLVLTLLALAGGAVWRAGGRAALEMAWAADLLRLRESWERWS